ncbi:conserved hypothetical protein [Listeria monocytogenes F6900]|uniref:Uncharacterized protein n=1 Tax=Listeria monocytogenes serovar 1/2a (strain ATCC BAA-679 / EGD-e) TaxID=169963 RepID=Q6IEH5_LISMO|nr:hypothetical protein LMOf6854_0435 [Listeria monocytogenes str. 1/2a F6854] [Listeria monocytogenes serotype 1/2a str. F6854]EEW23246.1 conserved hypothetical protein [Listeria monocytogenes F6900]EFF99990.1 conserved hypothetical protein [Listeria monocytogenes J2818]DAA05309.1 TPA_exp: hypothetical protein NT01LM0428 [Listeria monocytogenes EGD-e]
MRNKSFRKAVNEAKKALFMAFFLYELIFFHFNWKFLMFKKVIGFIRM